MEPIPKNEQARGEIDTRALLGRQVDTYLRQTRFIEVMRGIQGERPSEAESIQRLIEINTPQKERTGRSVDMLARQCGMSDGTSAVLQRLEDVIDAMNFGEYNQNGINIRTITSNDLPLLEGIRDRMRSGDFIVETATSDDERYVEGLKVDFAASEDARVVRESEQKEGVSKRHQQFSIDSRLYDSGARVDIIGEEHSPEHEAGVILYPGRQVVISVRGWNQENFPEMSRGDEEFTYAHPNAAFYYDNPGDRKKARRTISCLSEQDVNRNLGSYLYNVIIPKENLKIERKLDRPTRARVEEILFKRMDWEELGVEEPKTRFDFAEVPIDMLLQEMMVVADEMGNGELIGAEENNIENILRQIEDRGDYYGACQSQSVLMAAFCEVMGLQARIMTGDTISTDTGHSVAHQWPEVFLPILKKWVPVDSAIGTFLTYPSEGYLYSIDGQVNVKEGSSVQLKVDYHDNT